MLRLPRGVLLCTAVFLFAPSCITKDRISPESSAIIVCTQLAHAQHQYEQRTGRFAEITELVSKGDLNREKFERFQKLAVGYTFEMHLSDGSRKYSFAALPSADNERIVFVDQSGGISFGKPGAPSSQTEPQK